MDNTFVGYSGLIWQTIYKALDHYITVHITPSIIASDPGNAISVTEAMLSSVFNALDAIIANDYAAAWQATASNLQFIDTQPLPGIDVTTATFFVNRMNAYLAAYPALQAIIPQGPFPTPENSISIGSPIIPDVGLLEFYGSFSYETSPIGLTSVNFSAQAQACATAFYTITTALEIFQGLYPTQMVNVMQQQADIAQNVANMIAGFTSGTVASGVVTVNSWNQIVALPSFTMTGAAISSPPYLQSAQQSAVIRYALLSIAQQLCVFLLSLTRPTGSQVSTAVVRNNDTLMDIANRELGDYTRWVEIAALNNLQPPWIGPTTTASIAGWGTKIIIPSPGTSSAAAGNKLNYNQDFLGTDLYTGPINGAMPAWTGEFQTITGLQNLSWALGRRLQTTLNTLLFHSDYGSRMPAEIGQIQSSQTARHILAYGQSALLTDPRVQAVVASTVNIKDANTIEFQGIVHPIGDLTARASVNEVIIGIGGPT